MPAKLKNLNVTSVDFVDAGANPGAKISIYKRADEKNNSEKNSLSVVLKSIGVNETEFLESLTEKLAANLEKFSKADEINEPSVNDDEEEENSEPIEDNPDDDPTKKVDEEFAKSDENEVEEKSVENDLRKKLDPVQLDAIESIEKSFGVHIHLEPNGAVDAGAVVEPSAPPVEEKAAVTFVEEKDACLRKSGETADLTTALAQVVKNLQGQVEKAADKEFVELAKKYEILGLKAEELAPMLKQAKRTDPTLYETAVAVMDGAVAAIEPMFSEVGKRGAGFVGNAQAQVEKMASEIRKNNPDISYHQSIDKVFQENPELRAEFDF